MSCYTGISTKYYHNLALLKNGKVNAWGNNNFGEIEFPIGIVNNVLKLAAGGNHSIALLKDGTVTGWGDNKYGQLDIPSSIQSNVTGISAGLYHNLALLKDGNITGWGAGKTNDYPYSYLNVGQLIFPPGLSGNIAQIEAGYDFSAVLLKNGKVTGWGGGLGYGYSADITATGISAGPFNIFALLTGGIVTGIQYPISEILQTTGISKISRGFYHTVYLLKDGRVTGSGEAWVQGLGKFPTGKAVDIAAGYYHSLALLEDGTVTGWGINIPEFNQASSPSCSKLNQSIVYRDFSRIGDNQPFQGFAKSSAGLPLTYYFDNNNVLARSGNFLIPKPYVVPFGSNSNYVNITIVQSGNADYEPISITKTARIFQNGGLYRANTILSGTLEDTFDFGELRNLDATSFAAGNTTAGYPKGYVLNYDGNTAVSWANNIGTTVYSAPYYLYFYDKEIGSQKWKLNSKIPTTTYPYWMDLNGKGDIFACSNQEFGNSGLLIYKKTGNVWNLKQALPSIDSSIYNSLNKSTGRLGTIAINYSGDLIFSANNLGTGFYINVFSGDGENWSLFKKLGGTVFSEFGINVTNNQYYDTLQLQTDKHGDVLLANLAINNSSPYFKTIVYKSGKYNDWSTTQYIPTGNMANGTFAYSALPRLTKDSKDIIAFTEKTRVYAFQPQYTETAYTGISILKNKNGTWALDNIISFKNLPINTGFGNVSSLSQQIFSNEYASILAIKDSSTGYNYADGASILSGAIHFFTGDSQNSSWKLKESNINPANLQDFNYSTSSPLEYSNLQFDASGNNLLINVLETYPQDKTTPILKNALSSLTPLGRISRDTISYVSYPKIYALNTNYQNITFPPISDKNYGSSPFYLSGFSDSNLPLSYSSSNPAIASIYDASGVQINSIGSVTITATQTGDSNFEPASPVSRSFNVIKGNQTITFPAIATKTSIDSSFNINATSTNNTIPLSYSSSNTNVATISNNGTINIILVGSSTITVSQPADSNYNAADSVTRNLLVLNSPSVRIANLSGSIANGFFGSSLAINNFGNVLIVGSPFADISGNGVVVKAAGLSSAFINKTGWELYSTRSNFLSYEYLGSSVAINDTGNIIALGAIGTTALNGNINAGNYYISAREQTCQDIKLLDQNPVENYTIPNIKVQLDATDSYSLNQDQLSITYWKNKVNFNKGYNNSYNDGDAITFNSNIRLIDIEANQFSGLLDYNNPKSGDYIIFNNVKFVYLIDFSDITGLNNLINNNSTAINKINSKIINDTTLLLSTSGANYDKARGEGSLIKTNYLSGSNQGVVLASHYSIFPSEYLNFTKIVNDVQNIYACRHSETGEINSSYRRDFNNIDFNLQNEYFLAILKNGKITGFGTNYSGRLLGTTQSTGWNDSPVGKITGAVKLSLGSDFALALLDNKRITGWGNNFSGKATLGNNLTGVIDISAGGNHSLALLADGKVTGWGDNTYSQAFNGNNLTNISGISAGWLHSLALDNTGKITGWGYNDYGQASIGNSLTGAKEISAGKFHSLAILNSENRITGWGDDYFDQIKSIHKIIYSYQTKFTGITQTTNKGNDIFLLNNSGIVTGLGNFSYYQQLQGIALTGITQISNSRNHVMMVNNINKITGFGNNNYSQISDGFSLTGVSEVGAGNTFSIALLKNRRVTGWGDNTDDQAFGANDLTGVKAISVGVYHSLAILNNNTVTGWGNDIYGQITNGNELTGVSGISAGELYSLALFNNGTITGWGDDSYGQASIGNNLTGVASISAGSAHSLALLKNGRVTGWGYSPYADGGNNLTGVSKISAGFYNSTAILNDRNSVTGWGNINTLIDLFNVTSTKSLGPIGFSGISAGLFSSYAYSGDNKKIFNFGQQYLNIDSLPKVNSTVTQLQQLPKYNFAQGVNFAAFIIENKNSGSMNISKKNISLNFLQSGYSNVLPLEPYSFDSLKSGKYAYSLTGSGFYNTLENYPDDDALLPKYQTAVMLSSYFTNLSTMIITGYTGSLPISLFFVEYGSLNSDQKTIQSYNNTGCYISTLNTGKLINLTGIGSPIKVNEPFYSDIQIGNLIMDTGRFEYYINNRLIYTGSTGFNFGQILLGNNYQYTGVQPISTYDTYPENLQPTDLTGIQKAFNGNLFEVLIYNSALNELNRNEIFYYLTNKWQTISNYYPSTTIDLTNRIVYNEKTKTNCSDCSPLLNSLPKQNKPHVLLFEYNLYGYSGTMIEDCDLDMQVYILNTGFYEQARKEPLVSNLDVVYITGKQKSIPTINARSQNVYNVADFNFGYNKIPPSQDRLKTLKSSLKLQQPVRMYTTGEYLKYPKIDGNGI